MYSLTLRKLPLPFKIVHFTNNPIKRNAVDASSLNSASLLGRIAVFNYKEAMGNLKDVERNFAIRLRDPEIDVQTLKQLHSVLEKHNVYQLNFKTATSKSRDPKLIEEIKFTCDSQNVATDHKEQYRTDQMNSSLKYYQQLRALFYYFYFKLPNELHERTPVGNENNIVYSKLDSNCKAVVDNHVVVGKRLGVLNYLNVSAYYLLKDAAILEISVIRFLTDLFQNELKFMPFRNPDTCHDLLFQGMGVDDPYDHAFLLENNLYWLTGSASFGTFCALRTSTSVNYKFVPERFFVCGRRYVPPNSLKDNGLYTACQRTNVHFMIVASSNDQMMKEFDSILDRLRSLYVQLSLDFRICYIPAPQLNLGESCRASIQLHSIRNNDFVEIAHVSIYNDFISKRLRMLYHNKEQKFFFLHIIEGCAISVPTLIACLLERSSDKMLIPECIRPYMYLYNSEKVNNK